MVTVTKQWAMMASHEQGINEHGPIIAMLADDSAGSTSTQCNTIQNVICDLAQEADDDEQDSDYLATCTGPHSTNA